VTDDRNFAEYRKKLEQLGADLNESAARIVNEMADVGMRETVRNTPVDTGHLRRMWFKLSARRVGNGTESQYFNMVYYGPYVNNGHRVVRNGITVGYVPGKRFLEQGINAAKEHSDEIFQREINRVKQKGGW